MTSKTGAMIGMAGLLLIGAANGAGPEPNAEIASGWWPDLTNIWTPVGWPDHLFKFNVVYDGTIIAMPRPENSMKFTAPWSQQAVQVSIAPALSNALPPWRGGSPYQLTRDTSRRTGNQGWTDHATPVLWTEWRQIDPYMNHLPLEGGGKWPGATFYVDGGMPQGGLKMRQTMFAHMAGAGEVKTGTEPLFAWVRLSVDEVVEQGKPKELGFLVRINAPHLGFSMAEARSLTVIPERSAYQHMVEFEPLGEKQTGGFMVHKDMDEVRLAVAADQATTFTFTERRPMEPNVYLYLALAPERGAHVDLLVPIAPVTREVAAAELNLGYEGALAESDAFWKKWMAESATVHTPEPLINETIARSLQMNDVIAIRNPETGQPSLMSGSLIYARLWATPTSMNLHMMLDIMGRHAAAAKYLEIFREEQGKITAPGPAYQRHPGYFSTPPSLTSIDWLSDHGAILHAVCEHALMTGDQAFIDRWTDSILKACEFIRYARAIEGHNGSPGVMAPATPTDDTRIVQAVWSDGWNYKGLTTAVRLLKRIGHPRAAEFEAEARDYKAAFQKALREKAKTMPTWTDAAGKTRPIVPTSLMGNGGDYVHPFYLDAGPLFPVYAGLMDADDELMRTVLLYFREGPFTKTHDLFGHQFQPGVLVHEVSSCEPCYSWNIFHSHQSGDRQKYLEGMYSMFTGALSRQTHVSCETRGGITGNVFASAIAVYLARLAVVDDMLDPSELHLLRLAPLAWVTEAEQTRFEKMATEFGPVTVRFKLADGGKSLAVDYEPSFRIKPARVVLHVPPVEGLTQVVVNGQAHAAKAGDKLEL